MIFHYICVSQDGTKLEGNIDSLNFDTAVADLQKRGLTVVRLDEKKGDVEVGSLHFAFKKKVEQKDIVIFSRQIATLFEAGVSALKAFRLLAVENDNPTLKEQLTIVSDDSNLTLRGFENSIKLFKTLKHRSVAFSISTKSENRSLSAGTCSFNN
jgi:type IV pilus assembly protein PilC